MANLYTVIPGLTPSQQEIMEAELFAKQVLEGKFPDLDLREGTGLRDLLLRPTAYAFALLRKATDYYFTQNTLSGVDNSTPTEVVDDILSNWFLTRNAGTYATISARLYFARAKTVSITTDIVFSPDNYLNYIPLESKVYPDSSLNYDAYSNEYYLDVELQAESPGLDYNISQGSLLYFTNFDPYFLHAEINYLISESKPSETNSEFIERAKSSISTRNLINEPSIISNLQSKFNYLDRVLPVGMGDEDLQRDLISTTFESTAERRITAFTALGTTGNVTLADHGFQAGQYVRFRDALPSSYDKDYKILSVTADTFVIEFTSFGEMFRLPYVSSITYPIYVHSGGAVDIYCSYKTSTEIIQFTTNSYGAITVYGPVVSLTRSSISGGGAADTMPSNVTFTSTNKYLTSIPAIAATCSGTIATITVPGHGLSVNRYVTISGVTPTGYNGTWIVTEIISDSQFRVQIASTNLAAATLATGSTSIGVVARVIPSQDFGFSENQALTVNFGSTQANKTVSLVVEKFMYLDSVQDYLEDPSYRVVCGDYLARGFNLFRVNLNVVSYENTAPSAALISSVASAFLDKLAPGAPLVLSELVAELSANGITNIRTPIGVTYTKYHRDLTTPPTGTITDYLDHDDKTAVFVLGNVTVSRTSI